MKKLIPFIICYLFSVVAFAQEGVNFRDLTYEEALSAAKAENKLLFVDCYAVWCGPCKQMTNVVFPKKEAGDYFNPRFVSVKYDMEKGEGKELRKLWNVRAYPTFLIIRPDGEIQHTIVGGGELNEFIQKVEKGLNEKTSLGYYTSRYKQGKISKKELVVYAELLQNAYQKEEAEKIRKELMEKLSNKEKLKEEYWPLFANAFVGSSEFDYVLANLSKYQKNMGREKIDEFLSDAYSKAFMAHLDPRQRIPAVDMAILKEQLTTLDTDCQPALMLTYRIVENGLADNMTALLELAKTEAGNLSNGDIWMLTSNFDRLREKVKKEELKQVAEVMYHIASKHDGRYRESLELFGDKYISLSHVGVYFEELTLEEALAKAGKMRKYLFVDCYTTWCGPCKMMTERIFPQEKMGDFLNTYFINVKYDMDKSEGDAIKKKYGVTAYPTFLILNPNGSVHHKIVGGDNVDGFIKRVTEGMSPDNAFGLLEKKYNEGNREKDFLAKYLKALVAVYSNDNQKVLDELMALLTDEEKMSADYWFIFKNPKLVQDNSEYMEFLYENREQFKKNVGAKEVDERLSVNVNAMISKVLMGWSDGSVLKQAEEDLKTLGIGNELGLWSKLRIAKAMLTKNQNQILKVCEKEVNEMSVENFPFTNLLTQFGPSATQTQKARWIKLGQKVIEKAKDPYYKGAIQRMLIDYEGKK